jgi:hypothetical protein
MGDVGAPVGRDGLASGREVARRRGRSRCAC